MIEAFHSYGLKTVFTAPELAFDSWICLCGAGRMRPAIDNAAKAIFVGAGTTATGVTRFAIFV